MKINDTYYLGLSNLSETFDLSASTSAPLQIDGGDGNDAILGGTFDYLVKYLGQSNFLIGGLGSDIIVAGDVPNLIYGDKSANPADPAGAADLILGGQHRDVIYAGAGNDFVNGGGHADTIDGGIGSDTLWGGFGHDDIHGGDGDDWIYANSAKTAPASLLAITTDWNGVTNAYAGGLVMHEGSAGELSNRNFDGDVLYGDAGNDHLFGDFGKDIMTGGAGNDHFVFDTVALGSTFDVITDFSHAADTIDLDNAVLPGLGPNGWLAAAKFYKGAAAHDASDRIIYNPVNGVVWFDQDGKGGDHVALKLCKLDPGLNIAASDFLVI